MTAVLLPFSQDCLVGTLIRRTKRFIIEFSLGGRFCLAHTNNSGSMLGLMRPGSPILVTPAPGENRKLPYTLEMVCLHAPRVHEGALSGKHFSPESGMWVGVNTLTPNRLLKAAFHAKLLPWAEGYTEFRAEAKRGQSRLDALLTGPGLPPLWVECKNVTLVEDGVAAFPDAVTVRGQKHVREMMDIVKSGERAAFFYCIQRNDARCFGPAGYIDSEYAKLFYESLKAGVEARPHLAVSAKTGIGLDRALPLAPAP